MTLRHICKYHPIVSIAVLLALPALTQAGTRLTIVADPGPFGSVERAASAEGEVNWQDDDKTDDNACTESFAAIELRDLLSKAADIDATDIALTSVDQLPSAGDIILLSNGNSNRSIDSIPDAASDDFTPKVPGAFRIRTFPRDDRIITVIKGHDRAGTLYGAYAYLEQLGVRFFGLGEQGSVYPAVRGPLPRELDRTEQPHYLTRGFWTWEDLGDRTFFTWMARNRLNFWCVASKNDLHFNKKVGMKLTAGGHVIQNQCLSPKAEYPYNHPGFAAAAAKSADPYKPGPSPARDADGDGKLSYFEAHPEWFGLRGGKRSDNIDHDDGDNYCTSNPDATAELVRNVVSECIDGVWRDVDVLNFWMLDAGEWCECDPCKQQGTYTDRLMCVIDATLKGLAAARAEGRLKRKVEIATLAYYDTLSPPARSLPADFDYDHCSVTFFPIGRCYVHALADPACTEINRSLQEDFTGWTTGAGRNYTGSVFIGEYYNVSLLKSLPVLFPTIMAADIPWYYRNGARHFHYMHTPTRLWGTWTLNQYLMARLLWNTEHDADGLLNEYFARFYPTTSAETRAFYRELEYATSNCKAYKHNIYVNNKSWSLRYQLADANREIFNIDHLRYEPFRPTLNDGPDLVEVVDGFHRARRHLDDALLACRDPVEKTRLLEDERRFAYGEAMIEFIHQMVRTALFQRQNDPEQARRSFAMVERQAAILEQIVDLVQVASSHANAANGLEATTLTHIYKVFRERYSATRPASTE
ncbi:MAG TPA: DUF4838 domain-containing protein [Phycisphaerae bacterium]|nr:DUF4838 domain-containing protein [Phycisphaerae bacterium]